MVCSSDGSRRSLSVISAIVQKGKPVLPSIPLTFSPAIKKTLLLCLWKKSAVSPRVLTCFASQAPSKEAKVQREGGYRTQAWQNTSQGRVCLRLLMFSQSSQFKLLQIQQITNSANSTNAEKAVCGMNKGLKAT